MVLSTGPGLGLPKISSLILGVMLPEVADLGPLTAVLSTGLDGSKLPVVVSLATGTQLISFINPDVVVMLALMGSSVRLRWLLSVLLKALVVTLAVGLSLMVDVLILSVVDLRLPVLLLLVVLSLAIKMLLSLPGNLILLVTILLIEFALTLVVDLSLVMGALSTAAGVLQPSVDDLDWPLIGLVELEGTMVAVDDVAVWSLVTVSLLPVLLLFAVLPPAVEFKSPGRVVGATLLLLLMLMSSVAAGDPLLDCILGVSLLLSLSSVGRIIWPGRGISLCRFANFFLPRKRSSAKMAFSTVQSLSLATKSLTARMTL